jgi:hypothetical protein
MVLNLKGKKINIEKGDLLGLRNGQTVVFDGAMDTDHKMVFVRPQKATTQRAASDDTDPYPINTDEIINVIKLVKETLSLFERLIQAIKGLFSSKS